MVAGIKILILAALVAGIACAQEFEVASVKPAQRPTPQMRTSGQLRSLRDNARLEESNTTMLDLIAEAYNINWHWITAPDWTRQEFYSVMATLPAGATKAQIPIMLQKLLAGRFKLALHHQPKAVPVYLLVVDKAGGKLKASTTSAESRKGCSSRPGQWACFGVTMESLSDALTGVGMTTADMPVPAGGSGDAEFSVRRIDRPVVDETGITGVYDVDLQWMPPGGLPTAGRAGPTVGFPPRDPSVKADSLFNAFEALGLKLEPGKHTFDTVVVDHAERVPTEN
jgi:uncharacterized protein (TIGR03435 family)